MAHETNNSENMPPKRQKFRDLAEKRTGRALEAISRIGNLSNRQLYEREEDEIRKIVDALREAVGEVETRFASPRGKAGARFKL
jgi:Ni,Fe-hydrogenase III large subunit